MKYSILNKFKVWLLFACAAFCLIAAPILAGAFSPRAKAATDIECQEFLPSLKKEISDFGTAVPLSSFYRDGNFAFVLDDRTLSFNLNDEYHSFDKLGFGNPTSVKNKDDEVMLVMDNANLYTVDLTDLSKTAEQYFYGTEPISGRCFDISSDYLITADGNAIYVYSLENGVIVSKTGRDGVAKTNTPVCLNENGLLFYISVDGDLISYDLKTGGENVLLSSVGTVSKMIARGEIIYYTSYDKIYSVSATTGKRTELALDTSEFDLGTFTFSADLDVAFKDDNLLITDSSLGAAQEFKIEDGKLIFTGFAIASGKTAYNRIGPSSVIKNNGKTVAVLDGYKITVIKNAEGDLYDKNNFTNIILSEIPFDVDIISLGKNTVVAGNKTDKKIALISLADGSVIYRHDFEDSITDICYADGTYYFALIRGSSTNVFGLSEKDYQSGAAALFSAVNYFGSGTLICVDVYGVVYLYNGGYVYKSAPNGGEYPVPAKISEGVISGALSLAADLSGTVYALTSTGVSYIYGGEIYSLSVGSDLNSFAMNFDEKTVYFTSAGSERIIKTRNLPNMSADGFEITSDFVLSGETADINDFKTYKVNSGAAVYKIKDGGGAYFEYGGIYETCANEYMLICEYDYTVKDVINDVEFSVRFALLVGRDENKNPVFVSANLNDLTEITEVTDLGETEYITTDVNAYYLPMITETDDFCLKDGEGFLRLAAKTRITAIKKITFTEPYFNGDFYYAALTDSNGNAVYGYIPANFTVSVLSENADGEKTEETLKGGNPASFRNSLIVIALAASIFGTSLFFILKKKS